MKKHKILDKRRLMKNTTSVMSIFVASLLIFSSAVSATTSSNNTTTMNDEKIKTNQQGIADVSPNIELITPSLGLVSNQLSQPGNNLQTMELWDLIFDFDVEEASGAAGNVGAEFTDDQYFYSARWASNLQHQYDIEGNLLKQYTVSGVSGCRDLAYDGDYLYGGAAGGTIWGWDPIGETLEVTITGGFQSRALAYNSNDDTFFVSNWGDPVWEVNRDGEIVDSFDLALTTNTYGFAYDAWGDGGPFMWVYDQTPSSPDMIYQWDLAAGEFTDLSHDTGDDIGNVIAGGLFLAEVFEPGWALLGGLGQGNGAPDTMFIYDIDTIGPYNPHDVGVKNIISPDDGYADEDMEVIVQVRNYGFYIEWDIPVNVVILKDGVDEEYNETEYIDVINAGETVDVEMPVWTPDDWQSASNEYIDYNITAYTALQGDWYPSNDYKEKWFELYFGYFHDVGCTDVSGPETGPAQTFPVKDHIKNFGQYDECCFKTYMEIAELDIENQVELLTQDFSDDTFPPSGWTKTHDNWMYNDSSYAGGSSGEARFYYSPESTDLFRLYTFAIDTSDYDVIEIEFKHCINHYQTPYALQVETSEDGVNWDIVWDINPIVSIGPETITILTAQNVGSTIYVSWTFNGVSGNIDNWYVDGIIINGYSLLDPEYEENQCITTIDPGEEVEFDFDDWTPEYLIEETTDTKIYSVKAWTELEDPEDENPDNDLFNKIVELDFFHDVGVKYITSPARKKQEEWSHLDNSKGAPCPYVYVALGDQDIECIVENIGTFPELDLTCYAEIYEYITNCTNGTLVYEDNITNIDLDEPLGGNETLNFDNYNFAIEGVYGLFLNLPDDDDDNPKNNEFVLGVGADNTPPGSSHSLDPATPDGENGWYASDVEVTLDATDPEIGCGTGGSGVMEIKYKIGSSSWQTIPGGWGTFVIDEDGDNIPIEYYAIDNVGNEESHNSFTIDMDQTVPDIEEIMWEAFQDPPIYGPWYVTFTCDATDATSGMDRVEMYINEGVCEVIIGAGPIYEFTIEWSSVFMNVTFWFYHYDVAGNMIEGEIAGSGIESYQSYLVSQQQQQNPEESVTKIYMPKGI